MSRVWVLIAACLCGTAHAQLMTPEIDQRWRAYFPKLENAEVLEQKFAESVLYSHHEIPPAYQHQPLGATYTVFYSTNAQLNGDPRPTNGNREPPWRRPGGLEDVPEDEVTEVRFLWLPPQPNGKPWPVIVYRGPLEKSVAVNMPVPNGWRWVFPANAIVGEMLMKKFSDGSLATYEVRMRMREIDDWDVEVFRPFQSYDVLESELSNRGLSVDPIVALVRERDNHPQPAFIGEGVNLKMPPIPLSVTKELLNRPFKGTGATEFLVANKFFHATASDQDNIVPRGYKASVIGNTRDTCINCHDDVQRSVDVFEKPRDWYDYIRGSDGIFSFNPFDPECFSPGIGIGNPRERMPFLNRRLEAAGIVAMYDERLHPNNIYKVTDKYAASPSGSRRQSGLRLERRGRGPQLGGLQ